MWQTMSSQWTNLRTAWSSSTTETIRQGFVKSNTPLTLRCSTQSAWQVGPLFKYRLKSKDNLETWVSLALEALFSPIACNSNSKPLVTHSAHPAIWKAKMLNPSSLQTSRAKAQSPRVYQTTRAGFSNSSKYSWWMLSNSNINNFSRPDMLATNEASLAPACKVWLKITQRTRWQEDNNPNSTAIWKSFLRICTRTQSNGWINRWWTHNEIWAIFKWGKNRIVMHSKCSTNSWWANTRVGK